MKPTKDELNLGRLGPAHNLRPAGAHKNKKRVTRAAVKAALRKGEDQ